MLKQRWNDISKVSKDELKDEFHTYVDVLEN